MSQLSIWNTNYLKGAVRFDLAGGVKHTGGLLAWVSQEVKKLALCQVGRKAITCCAFLQCQKAHLRPYDHVAISHRKTDRVQVNIVHDFDAIVALSFMN